MEENNNNTPDTHHNHKRATTQKKKTPRQRKYRLAGTHIDTMQEDKNPKEVEKYMQAQGGVQASTFSHTQQKHSPV